MNVLYIVTLRSDRLYVQTHTQVLILTLHTCMSFVVQYCRTERPEDSSLAPSTDADVTSRVSEER